MEKTHIQAFQQGSHYYLIYINALIDQAWANPLPLRHRLERLQGVKKLQVEKAVRRSWQDYLSKDNCNEPISYPYTTVWIAL